jgi:perosamine synthetase
MLRALGLILRPWRWRNGPATIRLIDQLSMCIDGRDAKFCVFTWGSGRETLCAALRAMRAQPGDEVIVQGYTCVVVPNAIRAAGFVPVFVDIDPDTLNLDPEEVERAITPKTRAILCQHTFGIPGPLRALKAICDRNGVLLIEDCAHIFPDEAGPDGVGRTGHMAFWSFGRDKALSGVTGGALIVRDTVETQNVDAHNLETQNFASLRVAIQQQGQQAVHLPCSVVLRLLLYPLIYGLARPFYGLWIGRAMLALAGKIKLLVPILTKEEKQGSMPQTFTKIPDACAALALDQLLSIRAINDHRRMLTRFYLEEIDRRGWQLAQSPDDTRLPYLPKGITPDLPLQKFPLFVPHAERIRQSLKKQNIHLHDGWTGCVICPPTVDPSAQGYRDGDDPKAELCGTQILSLPTHPNMTIQQAKRLIAAIEQCINKT